MPRYIVERGFPDGLQIPVGAEGAAALAGRGDPDQAAQAGG